MEPFTPPKGAPRADLTEALPALEGWGRSQGAAPHSRGSIQSPPQQGCSSRFVQGPGHGFAPQKWLPFPGPAASGLLLGTETYTIVSEEGTALRQPVGRANVTRCRVNASPRKSSAENLSLSHTWRMSLGGTFSTVSSRLQRYSCEQSGRELSGSPQAAGRAAAESLWPAGVCGQHIPAGGRVTQLGGERAAPALGLPRGCSVGGSARLLGHLPSCQPNEWLFIGLQPLKG